MKIPARRLSLATFLILTGLSARAEVKLPAIFSDHMVLLRDASVPVWGWAEGGENVTVTVAGQSQSTQAGADGKWTVKLSPLASRSEPTTLTVKGKNTIVINDVLIGEVWLGSGQSNMALTVNRAKDFEHEKAAANFPLIRMFREESTAAMGAIPEGRGKWVLCSPESVPTFSAVLYFFGRELHRKLDCPIGLINSSVGGTPIEMWIDSGVQRATPELKEFLAMVDRDGATAAAAKKAKTKKQKAPGNPQNAADGTVRRSTVGALFAAKIVPLIPYAIRGALWYQGEANSTPAKAPYYETQLKLLVTDWRARWGQEFPFAWAQLPNFGGPGRDWPTVREAMLKALALPKTGMAINIDIGEEKNIHPANKQEVGRRLSLWALGTVYGRKVPTTSGPLPTSHEIRGQEIAVRFTHADGGLMAKDGAITGFMIAGEDHAWKPAQARIEGSSVVVSSSDVPHPVAVRYAWENFPTCNLYNGAGLPATPFRTDTWK